MGWLANIDRVCPTQRGMGKSRSNLGMDSDLFHLAVVEVELHNALPAAHLPNTSDFRSLVDLGTI